jgi:hypothetical protein
MTASRILVRRIACFVLLAFIGVRLADAHLHVCLDGAEPPIAVHAADNSVHDGPHHESGEHEDRDVQPFDALLLKAGLDTKLVAAPAADLELPVFQVLGFSTTTALSLPSPGAPSRLRPPTRGPPR